MPDAITPTESEIIPPSEIGEFYVGHRPGPDDPPRGQPPVIDGEVLPPKPVPPQPLSDAERQANVDRLKHDKSVEFRIMNERPIFRGMPEPSRGNEPWRGHTWRYE